MPTGKAAAQAGHAFLGAFCNASPLLQEQYHADGIGTKIVLEGTANDLRSCYDHARSLGIPAILIFDSGHICPPHFDGKPVLTAVGIGPVAKEKTKFLRNLKLLENKHAL